MFSFVLSICAAAIFALAPATTLAADYTPERGLGLLYTVQQALSLQPEILFEKESVQTYQGALQSAAGDFDIQIQAAANFARNNITDTTVFPEIDSNTTILTTGLLKKFRTGVEIGPSVELSKTDYRGTTELDSISQSRIQFQIKIPLLKGFGSKNVAVEEITARHNLDASESDLCHQLSLTVKDTSLAYWNFLASSQRLLIFQESERRAQLLTDQTRSLIQAEQLPASDLQNVLANLADKGSLRISAEQALIESRFLLGTAIGLNVVDVTALPLPKDTFSHLTLTNTKKVISSSTHYLSLAENNRRDLLAFSQRGAGIKAQLNAAKNQMLPNLNINTTTGYDGFSSGDENKKMYDSLKYRQKGFDWSVGLSLDFPLENRRAKGDHTQLRASYRQNKIQTNNLKRTIASNVIVDISNLSHLATKQLKTDASVESYQQAVSNERQRFSMGEATLLNLLDIQDRLDSALLNQISTRYQLASAITELRYETGTLINNDAEQLSIQLDDLVTVPTVTGNNP